MTKTTTFVWDPVFDCVISELDGSNNVQAVYTNEPQQYGGVISQLRGTITSTLHADALGTTRALTDRSETVTDTYLYDAWGNEVASTGTTVNPFRWVGRYGYYTDTLTELVYVRARMYQPMVARWVSVDQSSQSDGPNLFVYVLNAVIQFTDPSGYQIMWPSLPKQWPGYGLYCGPRNGPGTPKDALDRACKAHDSCLATVWDWINPCTQIACERALCDATRDVIHDSCFGAPVLKDCLIASVLIEKYACRYSLPDIYIIFP